MQQHSTAEAHGSKALLTTIVPIVHQHLKQHHPQQQHHSKKALPSTKGRCFEIVLHGEHALLDPSTLTVGSEMHADSTYNFLYLKNSPFSQNYIQKKRTQVQVTLCKTHLEILTKQMYLYKNM